ncbi:MAG: dockerin type I repeat-containing protein [Candidatus Omnitrophica bacterium]|nr:dockerin type I repeat-containing protein [Candidatus Omnitrophota bacterium]
MNRNVACLNKSGLKKHLSRALGSLAGLLITVIISNPGASVFADNFTGPGQSKPRPVKEIPAMEGVQQFEEKTPSVSIPFKEASLIEPYPMTQPTLADRNLFAVKELAKSLAENPMDLNRDGTLDRHDEEYAQLRFEKALAIKDLPRDIVEVLDQNEDGRFDEKDSVLKIFKIREEVKRNEQIRDFSIAWEKDPLDMNQDGLVDLDDVDLMVNRLAQVKKAQFLSQDIVTRLDHDGNHELDQKDVDFMITMVSIHVRNLEILMDFADLLMLESWDINADTKVDEKDIQEGVIHYALAMSVPHLSLDILEALDQDGNNRMDEKDVELYDLQVRCQMEGILLGDLNNDKKVDLKDYLEFQQHFNAKQGDKRYWRAADFDGDGWINSVDFHLFETSKNRYPIRSDE